MKIVSFKKSLQTLIHSKMKFVGLICMLLILATPGPHKDQMYVSLGQSVLSGDRARTSQSNKDLMAESSPAPQTFMNIFLPRIFRLTKL